MKGYFLIFTVFLALIAFTFAEPPTFDEIEPSILERVRRSDCDFNACDRWCRGIGLPGGACIKDKCDCDRF